MQYVFGIVCLLYSFIFIVSHRFPQKTPMERMAKYLIQFLEKYFPKYYSQNKKKLSDSLQRLYPNERPEKAFERYQLSKYKKLMLLFFIGSLLLFFMSLNTQWKDILQNERYLFRNDYLGGSKQVTLIARNSDRNLEKELDITIEEQKYTEEQLNQMFQKITHEITEIVLNKNMDKSQVCSSLYFPKSLKGYPFSISWQVDQTGYIGENGELIEQTIPEEGVLLHVTGVFSYEQYCKEYTVEIRLLPNEKTVQQVWERDLLEQLQKALSQSVYEESIELPKEVDGGQIKWTEKKNDYGLIGFLLLSGLMFLLWILEDKDLEKLLQEKQFKMQLEYAVIVNKLALYIGSGMTVRSALEKLVNDYEKLKEEGRGASHAYEELILLHNEIKRGVLEQEAYENFGRRCKLQCYIKLATLLAQNAKCGNETLIMQLMEEAREVMEERKNIALKMGEEAGTKLLLPMIMMMGIVMILIIVPAFMSF